jgi:imidazole glycerol-phosphate synthase subunit HisF
MKKKRIIPLVLFKDGFVVQSKLFTEYRNLGNPFDSIRRLSEWGADEVAFIDIGSRGGINYQRSDLGRKPLPTYLEVLESVSETTYMPLASGGQIRSIDDISSRLSRGADKVIVNTIAFQNENLLKEAIRTFGSQCIIVSMDIRLEDGKHVIFDQNGQNRVNGTVEYWIENFNKLEVGELFVNSIERDGSKKGFDMNLINLVATQTTIPLIVCGGAGKWEDFEEVLSIPRVDAVAAANIFQHTDQSVYLAHKHLYNKGLNVRRPQLLR